MFSILARILPFSGTRLDSFIFRYSHWFDPFPVVVGTIFRYSHGIYLLLVLARILPFFDIHSKSTLFRYSQGQVFITGTNFTFFGNSPGFFHFSVFTPIRPLSGTRRDTFSKHSRFLPFYRYSPGIFYFSVLTLIRPFSGTRRDNFSILARILPFPDTRPDSTIFRYSH